VIRRIILGIFRVAVALSAITLGLTVAYYLTSYLYARFGLHPPALVVQVINTLLGVSLLMLTVIITRLVFRPRRRSPFEPVIETLERIAKGDFSARLGEGHPLHGSKLVQSVNHMAVQLDQMEKMRQEFISNVSHEMQSPLTSIRGFACALREDNLSADQRQRYLGIIEAESARLSKLSANLLKLASLESDQMKFEPKLYRLDAQIRELILACEMQWRAKHLEMDVALEEGGITADEDLLSQVWINLLHNAIKFAPEGGSVHVALHRRADRMEVRVADTGAGIAPEDQPHIFDRFYKADKSRRHSEGGNGLGLSIAKKVVDLHHGSIAVLSQPGSGATFIVELPLG
jgi:two-component system phosphate regulon sensor histidine kinase PhoR